MRSIFALAAVPFALAAPTAEAPEATSKYIVVMHPEHEVKALGVSTKGSIYQSIQPYHTYNQGNFKGFAASLTTNQVDTLKHDPKVAYVEADGILYTQGAEMVTQGNSTWGLSRISHRKLGASEYIYDQTGGAGTCAYILDTGIYTEHEEFEGRATRVKNYDKVDGTDNDVYGHGTHVAGTIGSKSYGVSKKAKLYAMKICNQNGQCDLSDVNAAILDTITDSAKRDCPNGVVINMSLGAPNSEWQSVRDSVKQAAAAGIFVAVAAGNEAADASNYLPASAPGACAAGAMDKTDAMASFSNFGKPVAVFAPGVDVLSTYNTGQGATTTMSGTSMASPHLAGLAAYLMGLSGKQEPGALCEKIQSMSTKNAVKSVPSDTKNYLAFNGMSG